MELQERLEKAKCLKDRLSSLIIKQEDVINRICPLLESFVLGNLDDTERPPIRLLFLGSTGVGKTEMSKAIADLLFSRSQLFSFDMSEYSQADTLDKFLGNAHNESEGFLGSILRKHKEGVLLFDEMEKAHKNILTLFNQILDEGRISTGNGSTYSLNKFIIIFTSNAGQEIILDSSKQEKEMLKKSIISILVADGFRYDFLGRFSEILMFNTFDYEGYEKIFDIICQKVLKFFQEKHKYKITYENSFKEEYISNVINKKSLGVRPLRDLLIKDISYLVTEYEKNHIRSSKREICDLEIVNNEKNRHCFFIKEKSNKEEKCFF